MFRREMQYGRGSERRTDILWMIPGIVEVERQICIVVAFPLSPCFQSRVIVRHGGDAYYVALERPRHIATILRQRISVGRYFRELPPAEPQTYVTVVVGASGHYGAQADYC